MKQVPLRRSRRLKRVIVQMRTIRMILMVLVDSFMTALDVDMIMLTMRKENWIVFGTFRLRLAT